MRGRELENARLCFLPSFLPSSIPPFLSSSFSDHSKNNAPPRFFYPFLCPSPDPDDKASPGASLYLPCELPYFLFLPRARRLYGKIAGSRVYIAYDALWNIEPVHIRQTKLYCEQNEQLITHFTNEFYVDHYYDCIADNKSGEMRDVQASELPSH